MEPRSATPPSERIGAARRWRCSQNAGIEADTRGAERSGGENIRYVFKWPFITVQINVGFSRQIAETTAPRLGAEMVDSAEDLR